MIEGRTCCWEMVIGLEVHAQISSLSKIFSTASTEHSEVPNTKISLFDIAMPGTLPVVNIYCIEQAVKTGLALSAKIHKTSYFDRKNYFYPDLSHGYQITQFYHPIVTNGRIKLETNKKEIRITRIHLEQDAGKSIHDNTRSYIDFNRAGVGLMEIVSEADFRSTEEVAEYIKKLRIILKAIGSCDGDMEKGSFRCDANVSVRKLGTKELGVRSEIKNLNSVKNIVQAIEYEAKKHVELLERGEEVKQCTLLFDVDSGTTKVMRDKENAQDYRYFPDPDLPPINITDEFIENIQLTLPELPEKKKERYINELHLTKYDAEILSSDIDVSSFFEEIIKVHDTRLAIPWITGELFGRLNKLRLNISSSPIRPKDLSELLDLIANKTISGKIAKQVFDQMFETGDKAQDIVSRQNLQQIVNSEELSSIINKIIIDNSSKVEEYKSGKTKIFDYFVGQIMKITKGKANPEIINSILKEKLR